MAQKIKNPYKTRNKFRETFCTTLSKVFEYTTSKYSDRTMSQFVDGGQKYTYATFRERCNMLSTRLWRFGISAGDKVAILSQNMPNWTLAFFAATAFGRVAVPILPDSSENEVNKHSKINKVEAMKEPFEKSATQKIRRFKYNGEKPEGEKEDDGKKE